MSPVGPASTSRPPPRSEPKPPQHAVQDMLRLWSWVKGVYRVQRLLRHAFVASLLVLSHPITIAAPVVIAQANGVRVLTDGHLRWPGGIPARLAGIIPPLGPPGTAGGYDPGPDLAASIAGTVWQLALTPAGVDRYGVPFVVALDQDSRSLQALLIATGQAMVAGDGRINAAMAQDWQALEQAAQRARRGHWASGGLIAGDVAALALLTQTRTEPVFARVEATIVRGRHSGGWLTLALSDGEDRDGGPILMAQVRPRFAEAIRAKHGDIRRWRGRTITMRGFVYRDVEARLVLEWSHPAQIDHLGR